RSGVARRRRRRAPDAVNGELRGELVPLVHLVHVISSRFGRVDTLSGPGRLSSSPVTEAAWRRRFVAARMTLPSWARDDSERLLYASNSGGKWELYAWDRRSDTHRQVTDRPEGTMNGALDPSGH